MGIKSLTITEFNIPFELKSAKNQPRVPAGSSRGGEFTSSAGGSVASGGQLSEGQKQTLQNLKNNDNMSNVKVSNVDQLGRAHLTGTIKLHDGKTDWKAEMTPKGSLVKQEFIRGGKFTSAPGGPPRS